MLHLLAYFCSIVKNFSSFFAVFSNIALPASCTLELEKHNPSEVAMRAENILIQSCKISINILIQSSISLCDIWSYMAEFCCCWVKAQSIRSGKACRKSLICTFQSVDLDFWASLCGISSYLAEKCQSTVERVLTKWVFCGWGDSTAFKIITPLLADFYVWPQLRGCHHLNSWWIHHSPNHNPTEWFQQL